MIDRLILEWLPGRYAVYRLTPGDALPDWLASGFNTHAQGLLSITRTEREVSVVIEESMLPAEVMSGSRGEPAIQTGLAAMRIAGTLDFSLVGILAKLTGALAAANVSVFVLSTYDTDILLVREADRQLAIEALRELATIQ